jgi:ureidoglycolate lyase
LNCRSIFIISIITKLVILNDLLNIQLNRGVWHNGTFPINKDEAHLLIGLPERIYMNDCHVVEYETDVQIEIVNQ